MKIHLISYGNEKYDFQREFFKRNAIASGFFDTVNVFSAEDLEEEFTRVYAEILSVRRGAGYWIWKPFLVKKVLSELPEGDLLIYCDAGCMINRRAQERFDAYISLVIESETDSLGFELSHEELGYTKAEVFDYFDTSASLRHSKQLIGGILFLQKSDRSMALVNTWNEVLRQQPELFTDDLRMEIQHPEFNGHRHDQSIFSIIRKMYGTEIIADETYFEDFVREGQDFPIWATRLSG